MKGSGLKRTELEKKYMKQGKVNYYAIIKDRIDFTFLLESKIFIYPACIRDAASCRLYEIAEIESKLTKAEKKNHAEERDYCISMRVALMELYKKYK